MAFFLMDFFFQRDILRETCPTLPPRLPPVTACDPSRQFSDTGFQCGSASSSRSPPLFTRRRLGTVADDCCLVTDAPRPTRQRLADTRMLLFSRTRTNFGDRAFSAAEPPVWNYLSTDLRQPRLTQMRLYLGSGTITQCENCAR